MRAFVSRLGSLLLVLAGLASEAAWGQCSLCRNAAAAQGPEAAGALNLAIVVLLAPAVLMFCGVYLFSFRYRNGQDGDERNDP